ncbi:hypothetical protein D1007_20871 [Hordeum vulgare]|nr:hypothetical protein D1007_20871 [Hordeum vulgare]
MICFYAVWGHFVDRVATQFWKRQGIQIEENKEAITYLHRTTVLKLKPGWSEEKWSVLVSEDPSTAEGCHAFNMSVRETGRRQVDYAPMHDEFDRELLMCVNDANIALSHPQGGGLFERTLGPRWRTRFHKMAAMLSCHGTKSVDMFTSGTSRSSIAIHHHLRNDDTEEDLQEEEQTQEEQAQEHKYDIDAPEPSQPTPHVPIKKKWNTRLNSLEYPHKVLPNGMTREEESSKEEDEEE